MPQSAVQTITFANTSLHCFYNEDEVVSPPHAMALRPVSFLSLLSIALVSCQSAARHEPTLAEAYIGPATVNLRKEISLKSPTAAVAHFGDKVGIVGTKRKFVRVRTRGGAEGWIEDTSLLGQSEMDQIKAQSDAAKNYPSQGVGTFTYELTNVRAQPNRFSPSYLQIKEGEKFDVLEHRLVEVPPSALRKSLIPPANKAKRPKKENKAKIPPPPAPAPPPLPLDWQDLSKTGEDALPPKEDDPAPVTPEEDWSLIRTASGQSGWVLTRRLYMAIPDEVAQYAEGKRITSYFKLGTMQDDDRVKDIWLWTTISSPNQPYDFDGFRVFIWSLRHHRYETALIQRRLEGYFPTFADAKAGTFSVCVAKDGGPRYRRQYAMVGAQVKFVDEKPCGDNKTEEKPTAPPVNVTSEGTLDKLKGKLKSIIK
jgi:hypothetical protein